MDLNNSVDGHSANDQIEFNRFIFTLSGLSCLIEVFRLVDQSFWPRESSTNCEWTFGLI